MDLFADLRYALRLLRKTPVFTVAATGTLALGIGASTTIFSLVQTMLLRPLPYQNPDQVVMVWEEKHCSGFPQKHARSRQLQRLARDEPILHRPGGDRVRVREPHQRRPAGTGARPRRDPELLLLLGVRPIPAAPYPADDKGA